MVSDKYISGIKITFKSPNKASHKTVKFLVMLKISMLTSNRNLYAYPTLPGHLTKVINTNASKPLEQVKTKVFVLYYGVQLQATI